MRLPRPRWLDEMPDGIEKFRAENRFYFNLWRIYASPQGSFEELATQLDMNVNTLRSQVSNRRTCGASDYTLEMIESLLGSDFLPLNRIPDRRYKVGDDL